MRANLCDDMEPLMLPYALETLPEVERVRVEAHLNACPACQLTLERLRAELDALGGLPAVPVPDGMTARTIRQALEAESPRKAAPWKGAARAVIWAAAAACLALVLAGLWRYPALRAHQREAEARANLKQLGLMFKMYANESRGELYPPVSSQPGVWAPDLSVLYPDYLPNPAILVNPCLPNATELARGITDAFKKTPPDFATAERIAAQSFIYTGLALKDEPDARAAGIRRTRIARERSEPMPQRLREGVERFLITDVNNAAASASAQAIVPLLIEVWPSDGRPPKTVRVLYMDGHVADLPFGSAFPALPSVRETFAPPPLSTP